MNIIYENLSANYGTTQHTRLLAALSPEYVRIDDRSMPDFLAFLTEYSKHIRFIDEKDEHNYVWSQLLIKDISVILANIISFDIQKEEKGFNQIRISFNQAQAKEEKNKRLIQLFESVYALAIKLNEWYNLILHSTESEYNIKPLLVSEFKELVKQRLSEDIKDLYQQYKNAQKKTILKTEEELDFSVFSAWDFGLDDFGNIEESRDVEVIIKLRVIYKSLLNSVTYLTVRLEHYFQKSIHAQSDHAPQVALLIAFLQIFKFAQTEINGLSSRYLSFYYHEILQQQENNGAKDEVNVIAKLASHINEYLLKKGETVLGGRDSNGEEIHYEVIQDVNLNKAEIASLKTIFMSRKPEAQIGTYSLVTGIYAAPIANSKDGKGAVFSKTEKTWPTFGEEQEGKAHNKGTMINGREELVEIGFALSSPILFLSEGNRTIELILEFNESSTVIFNTLLQDVRNKYRHTEKKIETLVDAFGFVFRKDHEDKNIKVLLSDTLGWNEIHYSEIAVSPLNTREGESKKQENWSSIDGLMITTFVKAAEPPIIAYDSDIHKGHKFALAKYPVLKVILDTDTSPYLYSFWENLELNSLKIKVEVDKVKNIRCYNDLGSLDSAQPFQPFGPIPSVGSYLLLSNEEICKKQIQKMDFTLKWKNLPNDLSEYYEAYQSENIQRDAYKIRMSALSDGSFVEIAHDYPLFGYGSETTLEISEDQFRELEWEANPALESLEQFDTQSKMGFLKWTLSDPPEAFGHQIYPTLFSQTLLDKALSQLGTEAKLPNQPYTPMIESIRFSYSASAELKVGGSERTEERFYHIHPFGNQVIRKNDTHSLLPQYDADGYLFIGLTDLTPQDTLDLLFELSPINTKGRNIFRLPEIEWAYLSKDKWVTFVDAADNTKMLIDTTDKFTKSGVIRLQIPEEISDRNHILKSDLHWLSVKIKGEVSVLCHAIGIHTQAVMLRRKHEIGINDPVLLPYFIDNLVEKRAEIMSLSQPYASFGGRQSESELRFYQRISERIRHKNRAITSWDYERLILENFPTLFQVKVLSNHTNPRFFTKPNDICIVIAPKPNVEYDGLTPKVNQQMLTAVKTFIEKKVSPFVKIKIRNPIYEFIRIRCNVKFTDNTNVGSQIAELHQEIQRMICPWAENQNEEIYIGGMISIDAMQNYLKSLPYIKFITKFSVLQFYCPEEDKDLYVYHDSANKENEDEKKRFIEAYYPWSVLIPDEDHEIIVIEKEEELQPEAAQQEVPFQNRMKILKRAIKITRKLKKEKKEAEKIENKDEKFSVQIEL